MHLPGMNGIVSSKSQAVRRGQRLESPAERPIQLTCVLVALIAVASYYFAMRPTTTSSPVDTTSLDYLLTQCRAGRDSVWAAECERRTRAEDEKRKGSR
jgi:hypothetical protein